MKITKTGFDIKVNEGSSWKIYILKDFEAYKASNLMSIMATANQTEEKDGGYWGVQGCEVLRDCRVPSFFHDRGYWMVSVEHNHGDWKKPQTYELYIVE